MIIDSNFYFKVTFWPVSFGWYRALSFCVVSDVSKDISYLHLFFITVHFADNMMIQGTISYTDACLHSHTHTYNETCSLWMRRYLNMKITLGDIAGLLNAAFFLICRIELVQSGFSCIGISPLNHIIFIDLNFSASLIGHQQKQENSDFTYKKQLEEQGKLAEEKKKQAIITRRLRESDQKKGTNENE